VRRVNIKIAIPCYPPSTTSIARYKFCEQLQSHVTTVYIVTTRQLRNENAGAPWLQDTTNAHSAQSGSLPPMPSASFEKRVSHPQTGPVLNDKSPVCYNADVGRPSFERQKEANREYVLVTTHRIYRTYKTFNIFLLNLLYEKESEPSVGTWS
jgi:hypothetical protein